MPNEKIPNENQEVTINDLPAHMVENSIFPYLPSKSLGLFGRTNRKFHKLVANEMQKGRASFQINSTSKYTIFLDRDEVFFAGTMASESRSLGEDDFFSTRSTLEKLKLPIKPEEIEEIKTSESHLIIRGKNGKFYGKGENSHGELGTGNSLSTKDSFIELTALSELQDQKGISRLEVCRNRTLVFCKDGTVYGAGANTSRALGLDEAKKYLKFVEITPLTAVLKNEKNYLFFANINHTAVIIGQKLFLAGNVKSSIFEAMLEEPKDFAKFDEICNLLSNFAENGCIVALDFGSTFAEGSIFGYIAYENGKVITVNRKYDGNLRASDVSHQPFLVEVPGLTEIANSSKIKEIHAYQDYTVILYANGIALAEGNLVGLNLPSLTSNSKFFRINDLPELKREGKIEKIHTHATFCFLQMESGRIFFLGTNRYYQSGIQTEEPINHFTRVPIPLPSYRYITPFDSYIEKRAGEFASHQQLLLVKLLEKLKEQWEEDNTSVMKDGVLESAITEVEREVGLDESLASLKKTLKEDAEILDLFENLGIPFDSVSNQQEQQDGLTEELSAEAARPSLR